MIISYTRSGVNQNDASTYTIIKLYFEQADEQPNIQPNAQADKQTDEHIITKLNLLFNYINEGVYENCDEIGLKPSDRIPLITLLKRIGLYTDHIETYRLMPAERILDDKIMTWCIKEIYLSPHKVFLNNLNWDRLTLRYLKTKKYIMEKPDYRLEEIINYCIVCLQEELEKREKF